MTKSLTFKRRDFFTTSLQISYYFFILTSILLITYICIEEFKTALTDYKTSFSTLQDSFNQELAQPSVFSKFKLFQETEGIVLFTCWLLASLFFGMVFNRRVKSFFNFFTFLLFLVLLIYNFWQFFVAYAYQNPDILWVKWVIHADLGDSGKLSMLVFWIFYCAILSYSVLTKRYLGVFIRLDYLFQSILRGNWDSHMFFRDDDDFKFVAISFNALKEHYLNIIFNHDEKLIEFKDKLIEFQQGKMKREDLVSFLKR